MAKKEKYFRNRSNTGWIRYILAGSYNTKKQAMDSAKGLRAIGGKAKVLMDKKTKKYKVWGKF